MTWICSSSLLNTRNEIVRKQWNNRGAFRVQQHRPSRVSRRDQYFLVVPKPPLHIVHQLHHRGNTKQKAPFPKCLQQGRRLNSQPNAVNRSYHSLLRLERSRPVSTRVCTRESGEERERNIRRRKKKTELSKSSLRVTAGLRCAFYFPLFSSCCLLLPINTKSLQGCCSYNFKLLEVETLPTVIAVVAALNDLRPPFFSNWNDGPTAWVMALKAIWHWGRIRLRSGFHLFFFCSGGFSFFYSATTFRLDPSMVGAFQHAVATIRNHKKGKKNRQWEFGFTRIMSLTTNEEASANCVARRWFAKWANGGLNMPILPRRWSRAQTPTGSWSQSWSGIGLAPFPSLSLKDLHNKTC